MEKKKKPFKQSPKRYHPKGITVIYEDWDLLVVDKESGLASVRSERHGEKNAYSLLNEYVKKGNSKSRNQVLLLNRLDPDASGLLVFAKSPAGFEFLKSPEGAFRLTYCTGVAGCPQQKSGVIASYLDENAAFKVYSEPSSSATNQLAETAFEVEKKGRKTSLLKVQTQTFFKDQVRVHLADIGHSIIGDKKYGPKSASARRLMLHAESVSLRHPFTKESMSFSAVRPVVFNKMESL